MCLIVGLTQYTPHGSQKADIDIFCLCVVNGGAINRQNSFAMQFEVKMGTVVDEGEIY